MRKTQETKLSEIFTFCLASAAGRGVKDKTLRTYEQHFKAISKRLDVDSNISQITSKDLDKMILRMREEGLSDSSINSYTRTLKVFFSWCNEQGYTKTNLKIYKASETVKETYSDDELMTLLKKPEADCKFCEYRNWVIVNFLLNSGCCTSQSPASERSQSGNRQTHYRTSSRRQHLHELPCNPSECRPSQSRGE